MKAFYDPTQEALTMLDGGTWNCAYSGGKDSTSLVTWIEWLRRTGWIDVAKPRLVSSDTTVEDPMLAETTADMIALLRSCGWECVIVTPKIHKKLYNSILGRGVPPIHPGITRMRWCTNGTKIEPMDVWRDQTSIGSGTTLTGMRIGESKMRDGKLLKGCAAGGECGIPEPGEGKYSPIINWSTCQVVDWLNGAVRSEVRKAMADVFAITKRLVDVYGVKVSQEGFDWNDPVVTASRFGCVGCPAIQAEAHAPKSVVARYGAKSPIGELYDVWYEARLAVNRCYSRGRPTGGRSQLGGYGPIRLVVRKRLFDRVMDIQNRAGVVLVSPEDERFIRDCWERKVYPRGWSEADEATRPPELPLYVLTGGAS